MPLGLGIRMSKSDRNPYAQTSFNQWSVTDEGQITIKKGDVKHSYCEGYMNGFKGGAAMAGVGEYVTGYTLERIKQFQGKNLAEIYLEIIGEKDWSITDNKLEMMQSIKEGLGLEYNINQINKWFAGSQPIPSNKSAPVQQYMRKFVLQYLFGEEVGEMMDFI
jgi:hypothetical protein